MPTKNEMSYTTAMPKAVNDADFDILANSVFTSQHTQNRLIQTVSCVAVAGYLTKPRKGKENESDYGKARQLQKLLNGMVDVGGQDLRSWVDWLQKLVNVAVSTRKDENGKEILVITKAEKKITPARLYKGKIKKWWTSKPTAAVSVYTIAGMLRQLNQFAAGEIGQKAVTPQAILAAKQVLAMDGFSEIVDEAQAQEDAFLATLEDATPDEKAIAVKNAPALELVVDNTDSAEETPEPVANAA